MRHFLFCAATALAILVFSSPVVHAAVGPDQYVGDTAIYSGTSAMLKPNVLLIIDNSNAASEKAAGVEYKPGTKYTGPYNSWGIYAAGQQGEFKTNAEVVASADPRLLGLNCTANNNIIRDTLLTKGTYTGQGTALYPNIKNGNCDTAPKGATYGLGNYLNYAQTPPTVPLVVGSDGRVYKLIKDHTSAPDNRPMSGANWATYWTYNGTAEPGVGWLDGFDYTLLGSSQIKMVHDALKMVVGGARYAVNFGAMVYGSSNSGGRLIAPIQDLSSKAAYDAFVAALPKNPADLLSSQTARPQAEALLDAMYYFQGKSLPVGKGGPFPSPITKKCDKNFVILVTNGMSNKDADGQLASLVGDYDGDGAEAFPYGEGTHYLDDVAKKLYEADQSPLADIQRVKTATILAFKNHDDLVARAGDATHGRGGYFNVFNANELTDVLISLISNIVLETDTAFVAPVVPASPENRTTSGARIYLGFFRPISQAMWHGNLKKFGLNTENQLTALDASGTEVVAADAGGNFNPALRTFWSTEADAATVEKGGVGQKLLTNNNRKIYTYLRQSGSLTHASNAVSVANASLTATELGLPATVDRDKLIRFVRGEDPYDDDGDGNVNEKRDWILGDILHSKPTVFSYDAYEFNRTNELRSPPTNGLGQLDYGQVCPDPVKPGVNNCNKTVIFVGGNDGMLHAFRDFDGEELWSFVPPNLLKDLQQLPKATHTYFVDGSSALYTFDFNYDGRIDPAEDKVILVFNTRRGGGLNQLHPTLPRGAMHALDVTNPVEPVYLWSVDSQNLYKHSPVGGYTVTPSGLGELGETWSLPVMGKVIVGGERKRVLFFGAGYDNNEDLRFGSTQTFPPGITDTYITSQSTLDFSTAQSLGGGVQVNPKGRGFYALELLWLKLGADGKYRPDFSNSGQKVWGYSAPPSGITTKTTIGNQVYDPAVTFSFPADVTQMDKNYDGYTDRVYAGDTGGRFWRFDVGSSSVSGWSAKMVFSANRSGDSDDGRKIFTKPETLILDYNTVGLYFGTGDREHPQNYLNAGGSDPAAVVDRMYFVRDKDVDPQGPLAPTLLTELNLVDVTDDTLQQEFTASYGVNAQATLLDTLLNDITKYGWFIKLDQNKGEKILSPATAVGTSVFFTSYTPNAFGAIDICEPGNQGTARLYGVNYLTGEAAFNWDTTNDPTTAEGNPLNVTGYDPSADPSSIISGAFSSLYGYNFRRYQLNSSGTGTTVVSYGRGDRSLELGGGIPPEVTVIFNKQGQVSILPMTEGKGTSISLGGMKTTYPLYWMEQ